MDGCVSSGASLIQVFRRWRVVQREQRKKKRKKGKGREEGFFPFSSCPQHLFFFRSLFFAPSHTIWTPGIRGFSCASRLGCGRKKERQQSHQCVKVTRDQAFSFFFREGMIIGYNRPFRVPKHFKNEAESKIKRATNCCRTSPKVMLRVLLATNQTCLVANKIQCCKLREYWLLIG